MRAGQELATSESLLQAALTGLIRAQEALGILVGGDAPIDTTGEMQFPPLPAPDEALDDAEQRRADIQAQRKRAEAAQNVVRDSPDMVDAWAFLASCLERQEPSDPKATLAEGIASRGDRRLGPVTDPDVL